MSWHRAQPPISMTTDSGPGISLQLLNKQNPIAWLKQESLSRTPLSPVAMCCPAPRAPGWCVPVGGCESPGTGTMGWVRSQEREQLPGTDAENPHTEGHSRWPRIEAQRPLLAITSATTCKATLRRVSLNGPSGKGNTRPRVACGSPSSSPESSGQGCPVRSRGPRSRGPHSW